MAVRKYRSKELKNIFNSVITLGEWQIFGCACLKKMCYQNMHKNYLKKIIFRILRIKYQFICVWFTYILWEMTKYNARIRNCTPLIINLYVRLHSVYMAFIYTSGYLLLTQQSMFREDFSSYVIHERTWKAFGCLKNKIIEINQIVESLVLFYSYYSAFTYGYPKRIQNRIPTILHMR